MMADSSSVLGRIEKIEEKITSLNNRVSPRQTKDISETLKSSLRNCIDQITKILKDIESIEEAEVSKSFISQKKENLKKKKISLEDFLTGFLEEIFDSEKKSDSQKKLSEKQRELQSKGNISNLFAEDNTNKKKSIGERDKIKKLEAAFSLFEPSIKIQKPDLYEKLNNIEKRSSETDSKSSDSNNEDNLSNELNVDSSSDSSDDDSIKDALKKVNTSKLIFENKNEYLKVSKGKENKKLIKDDSLETLLNISDKKN
jgi:hypothetical protein